MSSIAASKTQQSKVCPRPSSWVACSASGDIHAKPAPSQVLPKRASTAKTTAECEYHAVIAARPCVICNALGMQQETPTSVHHMRSGAGLSQRSSHFLVLPLCYEHHQGKSGIHGNRSAWRLAKLEEMDCLALMIEQNLLEQGYV
ncbi:Ref family recombination enhancement nuclease [Deefgea sp. CFH1-16]|uniref:Ref family recombination enhancement nuclease n=1 Tax=Deefgea sp. CFH1-16 TaxID=2675457 RepID=UPI0015F60CB1|nr:Ref family recombination enhancement nuclease [Deefgea sp. CFH1-16]MBM5575816.1 hypothetical protein [Deefgea sp. CFH1-16]